MPCRGFCGPGASFSRGLHHAIGVDPDLLPGHEAVILYPWGFRVVEAPRFPRGRGWLHYLMTKWLLSSVAAAARLAGALGCRWWRVAGLKDACGVTSQLVALKGCRGARARVSLGRVEARLLGSGGPLRPGALEGNIFTVDLEYPGGCRGPPGAVPNFYGPQRFGVERPVSHIYGLYAARGDHLGLSTAYSSRMPLEARSCPGGYEALHLGGAWRGRPAMPPGVALEALQAYLFNRALSEGLRRGIKPRGLAEHWLEYPCPGGSVRLPAARLPSPRLLAGRSVWARLVREVAEEEGVDLRLLPRGSWRPLEVAPCHWRCRSLSGGVVRLRFTLPPGAFATTLLDFAFGVDWLSSWERCPGALR